MKKPRALGARPQIFVFLLLSLAGGGSSAQENAPADNPPARVARISYLKGTVSFEPAGHNQWSEATLNFTVTTGDQIYTDKGSRAELQVGPYSVRLSDSTYLTITNLNDQIMQLGLEQGALRVTVYQMPSGNTVEVDTPNGALTLLGPGAYRVDVNPNGDATLVSVYSGTLEITGGGVSQTLQAGQAVKLTGHDSIQALSVPLPRLDNFDEWSEERDQRVLSSASARYVSRNTPGYDDLDDYGHWEEVTDYGAVWYPTSVALEWVPYRYGHWAWIGPWGWTWVEDEPWGFCPFHYGRWVHIGVAWGWLPGPIVVTPVYAPALVAFVGGPHFSLSIGVGNVELAAWFPLGPGEPYFPWYHCRTDYIREVNVTNIRNVTNINTVININNINNIHYAYRSVATTAVPVHVFNTGQAVARQVVRLTPQQLARAQVIPHPSVNPTVRAALPGKQVSAPPVRTQNLTAARRVPVETRPARGQESRPTPLGTKNPVPAQHPARTPLRNAGTQPESGNTLNGPLRAPPSLITRSTPPPPVVPFAEQRRFMSEHPGRPLEPRQIENLRKGRVSGAMQDREFPPHVAPVPRVRPEPPPVPSRQRKP
jgi:hypothetical protein